MALTLVLSVGLDPELLGTRNLVLQSAGYTVVAAYSIKEAIHRFQEGDFDLVLLCQSITAIDRERLSCWIRASGSRIPVVSVLGRVLRGDDSSGVTVDSAPAALLAGIKEALAEAAKPAAKTDTASAKTAAAQDGQALDGATEKRRPQASDGKQREATRFRPLTNTRTG